MARFGASVAARRVFQSTKVAFSGDGRTLDFIDGNDAVVWDVTARREIASHTFSDTPDTLAVTGDARYIAVGSRAAPDITVWDRSAARTWLLHGQTQYVSTLTFAPDDRTLISGGYDLDAVVWDVTAPGRSAEIGTLSGHASEIFAVAVSPDGRTVAAASRDRTVLTWDRSDTPLTGHTDQVATTAVSPDGRLVASAGKDDTIVVWDPVARARRAVLTGHTDRVANIAFSPDGALLASASDDHTVRVWDIRTYAQVAVFSGGDQMYSVAFSPDGTTLAAGGADGTLYRWRTGTWQPAATRRFTNPAGGPARIMTLAYDPRGRWLAVAQSDGRITLVGTAGDTRLDAGSALNAIAVSADGALVAIGTPDGSVLIRDIARGTTTSLHAQTNTVNALAFSPDGRFLASGSTDRTVDLWDLRTRTLWATLSGPRYDIESVSWAPDSAVVYAGAGDHTVTPWAVDPDQAVATLCADLHRNFPAEAGSVCSKSA